MTTGNPTARSRTYVIAFVVGVLGLAAAAVFGIINIDAAEQIGLWLAGVFGLSSSAVAVRHRPTGPRSSPPGGSS